MKSQLFALAMISSMFGCMDKPKTDQKAAAPTLLGTWMLVSSHIITKGDTTTTFPIANQEMIKMFTDKEFAFFKHNTNLAAKDSAVFDAGSGTYTLVGEDYAEHLTYCNYREWENHDFHFKLQMRNDTLIQTGIEKIDSLNINQEIREIYIRKRQ